MRVWQMTKMWVHRTDQSLRPHRDLLPRREETMQLEQRKLYATITRFRKHVQPTSLILAKWLFCSFLTLLVSTSDAQPFGRDMYPVLTSTGNNPSSVTAEVEDPFFVQPAQFGSSFPEAVIVNFMLPPPIDNDESLCFYPASLNGLPPIDRSDPKNGVFWRPADQTTGLSDPSDRNSTETTIANTSSSANSTKFAYDPNNVKIGLLVRRGLCTVEQKVLVLMEIQEKMNLTGLLQHLLVYEDDAFNENTLISFKRATNDEYLDMNRFNSIGVAYLPFNYRTDLFSRIQSIQFQNLTSNIVSPGFMSGPENFKWQMLFRIAGPNEPSVSSFKDKSVESGQYLWLSTFFMRILIFVLFVVLPIGRFLYLWFAGGGRIVFRRRDGSGRIIGLRFLQPRAGWYAGAESPREEAMAGRSHIHINLAPELSPWNTKKSSILSAFQVSTLPEVVYDGPPPSSSTREFDVQLMIDETPRESDASSTRLDQIDKRDQVVDGMHHDDVENQASVASSSKFISDSPSVTTCTVCSICIDDFIPGEKIVLLPRCHHAFHKNCIFPWLLERQGICPLCKIAVLFDAKDKIQKPEPPTSNHFNNIANSSRQLNPFSNNNSHNTHNTTSYSLPWHRRSLRHNSNDNIIEDARAPSSTINHLVTSVDSSSQTISQTSSSQSNPTSTFTTESSSNIRDENNDSGSNQETSVTTIVSL